MAVKRVKDRAQYWMERHTQALTEAAHGQMPKIEVTKAQYEELKANGKPWTKLPDGREMWGGVVVQVKD